MNKWQHIRRHGQPNGLKYKFSRGFCNQMRMEYMHTLDTLCRSLCKVIFNFPIIFTLTALIHVPFLLRDVFIPISFD